MTVRPLLTSLLAGLLIGALPSQAFPQYFGQNKVQYRPFDFEIVRTENFDVYYYPQERDAALDAARMAERAYARLSRILQHEFEDRKPIILYASHADFQQTNTLHGFIPEGTGGVTEASKRRVIMPFTGSYAEFEHVFTHELVHAFQYDVLFRSTLRDVTPFGFRPHLWFMEGMAEYLSIGRIDANTEAWLRDAVLAGYLRSIEEMSRRDDYLSYRFGQSLWTYVAAKWGDEVIGVLLQRAPRMGIARAFESTLGISLGELSDEWLESVRSRYLPQLADYERPAGFATRLTGHDGLDDPWFLAPAVSPDGRYMTYLSQRDGFFLDLWLADARTGEPLERLVEASRDAGLESLRYSTSSASFSADGGRLAFAAKDGGRDALYIYDLEHRRIVKKLRFELNGIQNPSWDPSGERLLFTGLDGGLSDLFITDLDGELRRLTDDRHADLTPAWSPDGRSIAFATDRGPDTDFDALSFGNFRIAVYDLETGGIEALPDQDAGRNLNPVWSPDSRSIVWMSDRTGTQDLYLFDRDAGESYRLTRLLSGVLSATPMTPTLSWARRDGRLLFVYFERAGYNLYSVADPLALPRTPLPAAADVHARAPEPADSPEVAPSPDPETTSLTEAAPAHGERLRERLSVRSYYLAGDGVRPSARMPERADSLRPISVVALLDSAALALPDTSDFEFVDYQVDFSVDAVGRPTVGVQAGGYDGSGIYGGSYLYLSDMLGNHNIVAAGNVNGSLADAAVLLGYSFRRYRPNFGLVYQQFPRYSYLGQAVFPLENRNWVVTDVFTRDVFRILSGGIAYPLSTFQRVEVGANAYFISRDTVFAGLNLSAGDPIEIERDGATRAFFRPMAALVWDNTVFGWTGPVQGSRYRLEYAHMLGEYSYGETLGDIRQYANYKRAVVLATRVFGLFRQGRDGRRFAQHWGNAYFLRGYNWNSFDAGECDAVDPSVDDVISYCPLRDQLYGSSFAMAAAELRFPIITRLQLGAAANLPPVDAVLFAEGGMAWDDHLCLSAACEGEDRRSVRIVWDREPGDSPLLHRQPLMAVGAGIRLNIFYAILRMDWAVPLNRPNRDAVFTVSFGPSF